MEKEFANGIYYNEPLPQAPDFVVGSLAVHKEKFTDWVKNIETSESGYLTIDIKRSQKGKVYLELNTYKKNGTPKETQGGSNRYTKKPMKTTYSDEGVGDEIPF